MKVRPSIVCVECNENFSATWINVVFSAKRSRLYTLLIATTEGIYKVPVNGTVIPPVYGTQTKLTEGKLQPKRQKPCHEYSRYVKNLIIQIGVQYLGV